MESFKPEKINNNLEKEAEWNKVSSQVELITDGLGKKVDPMIKETVVSFIVNGLTTDGSCEGHLNRGRLYPYIHIKSIPDSEEFISKRQLLTKKMIEKGYNDIESIPVTDIELYEDVHQFVEKINSHRNEIESKIRLLLDTFYSLHQPVSEDHKLTTWGGFEISPVSGAGVGLENWEKFKQKEKEMSLEEKKIYLENSQAEMKSFTGFLKNRFLNSNES